MPRFPFAPLALATALAGCTHAARGRVAEAAGTGGRVITAAQIAKWNVGDAYEVLERAGGYTAEESNRGQVRLRQRRGQSSLTNATADRPLVVLDNTMVNDASVLRQLRAAQLDRIVILSAADATSRYGTGGMAGAVLVYTRTK
jgi:hypothetical protein